MIFLSKHRRRIVYWDFLRCTVSESSQHLCIYS